MAIMEKITACGEDYRRVNIFVERPTGRGRRRRNRPSSDAQKRLNRRNAETRLSDIIHNNFTEDDFAVRLDYIHFITKNGRNPTEKEARAKLTYYLSKLRGIYARFGVEFKYCYNIEIGARSGKVHHHLILSGSHDKEIRAYLRDAIEDNWRHGYGNCRRLEFDENGVKGLAHYFSKDDVTAKRWVTSHGLVRPTEGNGLIERSHRLSHREADHIDTHPEDRVYIDERYPGWVTVEVRTTAQAQYEDASEHDVPGVTDPAGNIYDGLVYPDYGGVFIELWQFREDAAFLQRPQYAYLRRQIRERRKAKAAEAAEAAKLDGKAVGDNKSRTKAKTKAKTKTKKGAKHE